MFELIFGIVWTLFSLIFVIAILCAKPIQIYALLFIGIFILIGVYLIIKGLKKVIKDMKTKNKGEECFGIIKNKYTTGNYVNNNPQYKVDVCVYIESENRVETISEVIGFNPEKYMINSYVKLKYYDNDINIIENVDYTNISENAKYYLKDQSVDEQNPEIITVNGVRYKRMD